MDITEKENSFIYELYTEIIPYLWGLPVIVFFIVNYFFNNDKQKDSFTACKEPNCARCQKYQILREKANLELISVTTPQTEQKLLRISNGLKHTQSHGNHRLHPYQEPNVFLLPGLKSFPWWLETEIADNNRLKVDLKHITDSFESINADFKEANENLSLWSRNSSESGQWRTFYLYNQGVRVEENCKMFRRSVESLEKLGMFMDGSVFGNAFFSVVEPGTHITEHYGPTNVRLRCHLGLQVPQGVHLTVHGESRIWLEKGCIVFDDSFLHSVESMDAQHERIVFIVDLWHPEVTDFERETLLKLFPSN